MVPFCFAMQTLTLRRFRHVDMVPAICVGGLVAFLAPMILGLILGGGMMALGPQAANVMPVALRPETLFGAYGVSLVQVSMLALMALVQLAVPLIFFARGAKSVPAVTLSLIAMLDAVLNPLWPWLAVSETPESSTFIGGAVIIGAVLLSIFGSSLRSRAGD
jgi:drug/metabolite transporter (DMT)-like permease